MVLFTEHGLGPHRVGIDAFDEEERDLSVLDSLDLDELLDVDLLMQAQLRLFIDLSQCAADRGLALIDLSFREI